MTLLAPLALFGLALLAIPLVVHLFKPRHVRQTPFSSLRWLHLTQQRMARRIQWHQVILFLLRAAFLTLLVLALTRPVWSPAGMIAGLDRILVLDVSRSMGRTVDGRPSPCEIAREMAAGMIQSALPGDRTAVLLTSTTTTVLTPWTTEAHLSLPSLSHLRPSLSDTQLDSSFEPIRWLLVRRRPGVRVEIVYLTDNPLNGWNTSAVSRFAQEVAGQGDVSLRLIDFGVPDPRNAWISTARLRTRGTKTVMHVEACATGDREVTRTLRVTGLAGVDPQDVPWTLSPGRTTSLELPLPSTFDRTGSLATLRLEPSDELPDDDVYYVDLERSGALRLLLIVPEGGADSAHRPGLSLETAIRSLAEAGSVAADGQLLIRTPISLSAEDVAAADVILLADVPGFNEALSAAIGARVREGTGLAMFLGPGVHEDAYNRGFYQPLFPSQSILPAELSETRPAEIQQGGLAMWRHWNDRHPLLAGLIDPKVGDLADTGSRAWARFSAPMTAAEDVLAELEEGAPALIARRVQSGRVVIINGGADDRWCDLPRRKSFVPFVDRLLGYLPAGGVRQQFASGEGIALSLPDPKGDGDWRVTSPLGRVLEPQVRISGGRTWLTLSETQDSGFYRAEFVGSNPMAVDFVVQPGRGDSRQESCDAETFHAWWLPAEVKVEQPGSGAANLPTTAARINLEPWFVMLASVVFLMEMILAHAMCPRLNPSVGASHRRRRGFVAPLREREGAASR